MTIPVFQIGNPDAIDRLISVCADLGLVGRVELLRAVRRGEISLAEPPRDRTVPLKVLERSFRPLIVIIGDDDYASTGPDGWTAVPRVLRWSRGAMVHATGADAPSYQMAIGMALECRRFALIETDTAHARQWGAALIAKRVPFLGLVPCDGGTHPMAENIRTAH